VPISSGLSYHIADMQFICSLPCIKNALPRQDRYEVETLGMGRVLAPDVADYKHGKKIELGLAAGSISQPFMTTAKIKNCPLTEEELRHQLTEHKALIGLNMLETFAPTESSLLGAVSSVLQTYATPPPLNTPPMAGMPPGPPSPGIFPPGMQLPFLLFMPGFSPGYVILFTSLSLGTHVHGFRPPPPGFPILGFPPGTPPFLPGSALFPAPPFLPPGILPPGPPGSPPGVFSLPLHSKFVPIQTN